MNSFVKYTISRIIVVDGGKHTEQEQAWISDLDPMLEEGFKIVFKESFGLEVQSVDQNGVSFGVKNVYLIRILAKMIGNKYEELKIQISTESNIFLMYVCNLDQRKFERIRRHQGLNFGFGTLLTMLIKQITLCDKQMKQYCAILSIRKTSPHRLDFLENIQYKRIQLISLQFQQLDSQLLKNCITYRFTKAKTKSQMIQRKLKEMMGLVKLKNHSLLTTITKNIILNDPSLTIYKQLK